MRTGALASSERRRVSSEAIARWCTSATFWKMASVSFTFFGAALDDGAEPEAQEVEFVADGLDRWSLLVGVALASDELLADLGCRQAAIQPGGLEGGVGLEIVLHQIAEIRKEMGQVELGRLATT